MFLGKFRSNFGLCLSGNMNETVLSSLSKPPSTPPLKLQKQSSKASTNDLNSLSTPKLRSSSKNLLLFRMQTPTNVNPIVACSHDPSIQLTSFRKVDQDNTITISSSTRQILENNPNSSSNLFPYQSDSDITNSSHLLRLEKHPSRYSLPDVSLQRSHNTSLTKIDTPVVVQFLSTTANKTDHISTGNNEQDKVVAASTFGDSSMRSKVLQASFRGKTSTMDRRTATISTVSFRSQVPTNTKKRNLNDQPKYFITKTDDKTIDGPVNCSLNSVLNLTLQLEQSAIADYERRHTIATNEIDPLLLNGLTDDENQLNLLEKTNGHQSPMIIDDNPLIKMEDKDDMTSESNRLQTKLSNYNQVME